MLLGPMLVARCYSLGFVRRGLVQVGQACPGASLMPCCPPSRKQKWQELFILPSEVDSTLILMSRLPFIVARETQSSAIHRKCSVPYQLCHCLARGQSRFCEQLCDAPAIVQGVSSTGPAAGKGGLVVGVEGQRTPACSHHSCHGRRGP